MKLIVTVKFTGEKKKKKKSFASKKIHLPCLEEDGLFDEFTDSSTVEVEETRADYIFRESIEGVVSRFFSPHG